MALTGQDMPARRLIPEIMDDPALPAADHLAALRGLARLNRASRASSAIWRALRPYADPDAPLRVLDIATGSGDVALGLARCAAGEGVRLELTGCDVSPRACEAANRRAQESGLDARFFTLDALSDPLPENSDAVVCSLFLHHLSDADAERLLERMASAARRVVVVSDLARSARGTALAWAASRTLTRSRVVHTDAVLSARAAFAPEEALALARRAGLAGARVARAWPCRFLLVWERP